MTQVGFTCKEVAIASQSQHPLGWAGIARVPAGLEGEADGGTEACVGPRTSADWWYAPAVAGCLVERRLRSARAARAVARNALRGWGLMRLAEDAEIIVGELAANAVKHAGCDGAGKYFGLRLLRRSGEVVCMVLDPSTAPPTPRTPDLAAEAGLGLQMVGALSDAWGWSPVPGGGKAVWAILICG